MVAEAGITDSLVPNSFLRGIPNNESISRLNLLLVKVGSSRFFCGRDFRREEVVNGREVRHGLYMMKVDIYVL